MTPASLAFSLLDGDPRRRTGAASDAGIPAGGYFGGSRAGKEIVHIFFQILPPLYIMLHSFIKLRLDIPILPLQECLIFFLDKTISGVNQTHINELVVLSLFLLVTHN